MEEDDFREEDGDSHAGDEPSCPFCTTDNEMCSHFLGSRDLNFCEDFTVDDDTPLAGLGDPFYDLGEAVRAFLTLGGTKSAIAALEPERLRNLVRAVADGNDNEGFTEYLEQTGQDPRGSVEAASFEENSGPCFCSVVRMFWAQDVPGVLRGMRERVVRDILLLKGARPPDDGAN